MNIETVRKTIALCSSLSSCKCFDRIFNLLPFADSEFNIEHIRLNRDILVDYNTQLIKHYNKDLVYNQNFYQTVSASTLKSAFEHHIANLRSFQRYIILYLQNDSITFENDNRDIDMYMYIDTVLKLTQSLEQTNRVFNNPDTKIPVKRLIEEVDFHIYNLHLFDDLFVYVTTQFTHSNGGTTFTRQPTLHNSKTRCVNN